jgi:hypothetical protein
MATYEVKLVENTHYVMGLREIDNEPNVMLIYRYPAGDIDTKMKNAHMMFGALYDLFQTNDNLKDGDTFKTEFGEYRCSGVHVIANFDMGPEPEHLARERKSFDLGLYGW